MEIRRQILQETILKIEFLKDRDFKRDSDIQTSKSMESSPRTSSAGESVRESVLEHDEEA